MKGMRKVRRGTGFRGVLNYVFGRDDEHKEEPGRLLGGNLSGTDPRTLAQEFGITRNLRPEIEKPVWHNSLRLPRGESVSDDQWVKIADDYMRDMGFSDLHPRCYVLHDDKEGQHIHIVASRIALDGSLYLGKNENLISTRVIQQLEIDHMLTITKGPEYQGKSGPEDDEKKIKMPDIKAPKKEEMEKAIRTGEEPPRQRLQRLLDAVMAEKPTAVELADYMYAAGVEVRANIASTGTMNGFSFSIDGVSFSGSKLGDRYKWSNLLKNGVSYDKDRDGEGLKRYRAATANSKVAGTDLSRGIADAAGFERVAAGNGGTDSRQSGTHGENGASLGSGFGYPSGDHTAVDTDSSGIYPERDADAFARQSEAVSDDSQATSHESDGIQSGVKALDARSKGFTGGDSKDTAAVLDSGRGGRISGDADRGRDSAGVTVTAWDSEFKKASAKRRKAKEQKRSPIKKMDYAQVRDAAHMADLVSYMESVGLEVKKDGVKDWIVDDRYRVTQKPDGHFVWCTWDQSRGGDGIAFLRDEMGLSWEQAIADLSGTSITQRVTKKKLDDKPISPPPRSKDRDAITAYLESRGISKTTAGMAHTRGFLKFVDYNGIPAAAFCGNGNGTLRSMAIRLTKPIQSWDKEKELTKLDVKHSDKSYPALWRGDNPSTVWIVEGGIDALAAIEWHRASKKPIPTIIVSGGAGVSSFLNQPHVQKILKEADTVYVAMENEKDQETQAKTDAAHEKQIDKLCALGCEKVIAWMPPVGTKDLADAWKAGVLPDPHDGSHDQQVSDNEDDVLMLPNEVAEAAEAVEAMAPVMRDD